MRLYIAACAALAVAACSQPPEAQKARRLSTAFARFWAASWDSP